MVESLEDRKLLTVSFSGASGFGTQTLPFATWDTAIDSGGNIVSVGNFSGTVDFNPVSTVAGDTLTSGGERDIVIRKAASNGTFTWARRIGGQFADDAKAVDVDQNGNIYLTGFFTGSVDFGGGNTLNSGSNLGLYILKLNGNGDTVWARQVSVSAVNNDSFDIDVTPDGNQVAIAGFLNGSATFGSQNVSTNGANSFIAKADGSGTFLWAKTLGTTGTNPLNQATGVAIDPSGNVAATGIFVGTIDLNPDGGTDNRASAGTWDGFLVKLASANGAQQFGTTFGGPGFDIGFGVLSDAAGNLYVSGYFGGTADFNPSGTVAGNADILTSPNGRSSVFVTSYGANNAFRWVRNVGASNGLTSPDLRLGDVEIAQSTAGTLVVAGTFDGTATVGGASLVSAGAMDTFVAEITTDGSIGPGIRAGGVNDDIAEGIATGPNGAFSLVGTYSVPQGGTVTFGQSVLPGYGSVNSFVARGSATGVSRPNANYDGDNRTDITVFRPATAQWFTRQSSNSSLLTPVPSFGDTQLRDIPVAGDFNGDGRSEPAIFRRSNGQWIWAGQTQNVFFGGPNLMDIPVPADFDGDGRTDLAVFRSATAQWFITNSSTGVQQAPRNFGDINNRDIPVPADYDGDGRADLAVFRVATGQWFISPSGGGSTYSVAWGGSNFLDIPAPGDYDADGRADVAVFRPSTTQWLIRSSITSNIITPSVTWGGPNYMDVPVNAPIASLMARGVIPGVSGASASPGGGLLATGSSTSGSGGTGTGLPATGTMSATQQSSTTTNTTSNQTQNEASSNWMARFRAQRARLHHVRFRPSSNI